MRREKGEDKKKRIDMTIQALSLALNILLLRINKKDIQGQKWVTNRVGDFDLLKRI